MSRIFKGFLISLSMFSVIPAPYIWDSGAFGWVIPSFPLVGLIIGALWLCAVRLLALSVLPLTLCAAIILLTPLFLSGFIHIDGYMDTCDAVFSRAGLQKKRDILKDTHVGAFAVIALGVYLTVGFAAACPIAERSGGGLVFLFIPMLSRCVAGAALLCAKPISPTGFGADFSKDAGKPQKRILAALTVICGGAGLFFGGETAFFPLLAVFAGGLLACAYSIKQLDGISGDLCGFIITVGELCGLVALAAF